MGYVATIFLPLALAFIMFSLGLALTLQDFIRVARQPKDFCVGLISQVIILPLVGLALVTIWPASPEIALGVMIIAAAPGGVTSHILTSFGRGDVALSISLTAVISLLSVITIPVIVVFAHNHLIGGDPGSISIISTALSIFLIVTVPVILGLLTRRFANNFVTRFASKANALSSALFIIILGGAIFQERSNIIDYFAQAGLITLTLNITMMVLAYVIAQFFASGKDQRIAISIECGLQNGTLAIAVSTILFGGGLTTIPAATYSLIMFGTALLFIAYLRIVKH